MQPDLWDPDRPPWVELRCRFIPDVPLWVVPTAAEAACLVDEGIPIGRIWTFAELETLLHARPTRAEAELAVRTKLFFDGEV